MVILVWAVLMTLKSFFPDLITSPSSLLSIAIAPWSIDILFSISCHSSAFFVSSLVVMLSLLICYSCLFASSSSVLYLLCANLHSEISSIIPKFEKQSILYIWTHYHIVVMHTILPVSTHVDDKKQAIKNCCGTRYATYQIHSLLLYKKNLAYCLRKMGGSSLLLNTSF